MDPLGIDFLRRSLGGGALTEKDLELLTRSMGTMISPGQPSSFGQGMLAGATRPSAATPEIGQLGAGPAGPPVAIPQMLNSGAAGRGPNSQIMSALLGNSGEASRNPFSGNWTPGPQGFPSSGGGGFGGGGLAGLMK